MRNKLLHIYRNTPLGREIFLQSVYFCKRTRTFLNVYIPNYRQFLMYFENEAVTVDLDRAFLRSPKTARAHVKEIAKEAGVEVSFIKPKGFTASTLPELSIRLRYMCCPRSISDLSTKISLGHIGPRVRNIIRNSPFAVLIPSSVYKEWKSISVFFGGSENAIKVLKIGMELRILSGLPLQIYSQAKKHPIKHYRNVLKENNLLDKIESSKTNWIFFEKGEFRENLYEVPHDSLVIVGAYGHGLIKELLFGSMMEEIQTVLPNNLLITGPQFVV